MCIIVNHCCTPEINVILYNNYQFKKDKKYRLRCKIVELGLTVLFFLVKFEVRLAGCRARVVFDLMRKGHKNDLDEWKPSGLFPQLLGCL